MDKVKVKAMQRWCSRLAHWIMTSAQGLAEGSSENNHGLYFDLTTISLSLYGCDDELVDLARARLHYRYLFQN